MDNDPTYLEKLTKSEYETFLKDQTPETFQNLSLCINPELFLETLLLEIRGGSIEYSSRMKKSRVGEEQLLLNDIETLEKSTNTGVSNEDIAKELETKKSALENLYKYQVQGAYIRSRAK